MFWGLPGQSKPHTAPLPRRPRVPPAPRRKVARPTPKLMLGCRLPDGAGKLGMPLKRCQENTGDTMIFNVWMILDRETMIEHHLFSGRGTKVILAEFVQLPNYSFWGCCATAVVVFCMFPFSCNKTHSSNSNFGSRSFVLI